MANVFFFARKKLIPSIFDEDATDLLIFCLFIFADLVFILIIYYAFLLSHKYEIEPTTKKPELATRCYMLLSFGVLVIASSLKIFANLLLQ